MKASETKMNKQNDITDTVRKYVNGHCNREELREALELFGDPYHHLGLHPVLFDIWKNEDWALKLFRISLSVRMHF